MAIVEMKKIFLIGMLSEKNDILSLLQKAGCVEINDMTDMQAEEDAKNITINKGEVDSLENKLSDITFALDFLKSYDTRKKGMFALKPEITEGTYEETITKSEELDIIIDTCRDIQRQNMELSTKVTRIDTSIEQMQAWKNLDISLGQVKDTEACRIIIGNVDKTLIKGFEEELNGQAMVHYENIGYFKDEACYFITVHKSSTEELNKALKEFAFSRSTFPGKQGTPTEIISSLKNEADEIQNQYKELDEKSITYADKLDALEIYYDGIMINLEKAKAGSSLETTQKTFVLTGWAPSSSVEILDKEINKLTQWVELEFSDPEEDEEFPVAAQNGGFAAPFEMVTNLYSTPKSFELDPSTIMAPFFAMFFGLMLSDAGYGIILALGGFLAVKFLKLKGGIRQLALVIAISGLFTIFWGAAFGGWFADSFSEVLPAFLFNPLEDPMYMVGLSLAFGFIQVITGICVKAYYNIKIGKVWDALFDQGFWLFVLFGLVMMAASSMVDGYESLAMPSKILIFGGAAGLLLTQGRAKKGILGKLMGGLSSLYNITAYFSDVVSYVRLFALGLATGIIGMVINQMCGMLAEGGVIGYIAAVFVFAGGHLFNLAINALGAFVHSARLQYIEFYSKFFEGGGKPFVPLKIRTKYSEFKVNGQ